MVSLQLSTEFVCWIDAKLVNVVSLAVAEIDNNEIEKVEGTRQRKKIHRDFFYGLFMFSSRHKFQHAAEHRLSSSWHDNDGTEK